MDRFRGFKSYFLRQVNTRPMPSGVFYAVNADEPRLSRGPSVRLHLKGNAIAFALQLLLAHLADGNGLAVVDVHLLVTAVSIATASSALQLIEREPVEVLVGHKPHIAFRKFRRHAHLLSLFQLLLVRAL